LCIIFQKKHFNHTSYFSAQSKKTASFLIRIQGTLLWKY